MAPWLADEEAAAFAVGGVHRLAARLGFALRLARADSVDQAFLAPLVSALAIIGQAVRPTAALQPAVALQRARPEVQVVASFLVALASRGGGSPKSCFGPAVLEDPLVASDPWARPLAAKGKGKGILGKGAFNVSLSAAVLSEAPAAIAPAVRSIVPGPFGAVYSASGKGNYLKGKGTGHMPGQDHVIVRVQEEARQVLMQDSRQEAAGAKVGFVVEEVVENIEAAIVHGSQQEAAAATGKEFVGEVVGKIIEAELEHIIDVPRCNMVQQVKQAKDPRERRNGEVGQVREQDSPKEAAVEEAEEVVDGFAEQNIEAALESIIDGLGCKVVEQIKCPRKVEEFGHIEAAMGQDSQQEAAVASGREFVEEVVDKNIEAALEHISDVPRCKKGRQVKQVKDPREVGQVLEQDSPKEAAAKEAEEVVDGFAEQNIEKAFENIIDGLGSKEVKQTNCPGEVEKKKKFGHVRLQGFLQPKQLGSEELQQRRAARARWEVYKAASAAAEADEEVEEARLLEAVQAKGKG
mmetsp:Transcript_35528/g.115031  ORF Transcript_35528/g.115031 Transcript_35528/m.115031 type:complete len:522 (+) Transcript_35528:58-1623(+)